MKTIGTVFLALPLLLLASCAKTPPPTTENSLAVPEAEIDVKSTTPTSLTIVWDAVPDAAGYDCILDDGESRFTAETSITYSGLEPDSSHKFRVRAVAHESSGKENSLWSADMTVSTLPEEEPEKAFVVTVDQEAVSFYDAFVDVVPADDEIYYYVSYVDKYVMDEMGSDDAYVREVIASIHAIAELSGKTFGDMFIALRQSGAGRYQLKNLKPDSEYYAFAFGFNEDGDITHPMVKDMFRTKPDPGIQESDMTFEISVPENKGKSATVQVVPSKDDEWYFFAAAHFNSIPGDTDDAVLTYYTDLFSEYLADMTFDEFAAENLSKGTDSYEYSNLVAGEKYRIFAFGVTLHGDRIRATTGLSYLDFTADDTSGQSEDKITITASNITSTGFTATFTPQPGVRYVCDVQEYSSFDGMSDEQIISKFLYDNGWGLDFMIQGDVYEMKNYMPYDPDTEYIAYAFGVGEDNEANTPLYKKIVRTLPE